MVGTSRLRYGQASNGNYAQIPSQFTVLIQTFISLLPVGLRKHSNEKRKASGRKEKTISRIGQSNTPSDDVDDDDVAHVEFAVDMFVDQSDNCAWQHSPNCLDPCGTTDIA